MSVWIESLFLTKIKKWWNAGWAVRSRQNYDCQSEVAHSQSHQKLLETTANEVKQWTAGSAVELLVTEENCE